MLKNYFVKIFMGDIFENLGDAGVVKNIPISPISIADFITKPRLYSFVDIMLSMTASYLAAISSF